MTLPVPNLDDRTFRQLVDEAVKQIPVHAPEWTDHNAHDPGLTMLELFAWLAEMQLYSLNRIDDRHRLKYLQLLGVKPTAARSAKVELTFEGRGSVAAGSRVIAGPPDSGEQLVFETDQALEVLPLRVRKLVVRTGGLYKDVTDFNQPSKNFFFAFGAEPKDGDAFYMGFAGWDGLLAGKTLTLGLYLFEADLPPVGGREEDNQPLPHLSAGTGWRYWGGGAGGAWIDLILPGDTTRSLYQTGKLSVVLPGNVSLSVPDELTGTIAATEELFWIRCEAVRTGWEIPPRLERVLVNTVSATEGQTQTDEFLGTSTGLPAQVFEARCQPVLAYPLAVYVDGNLWALVQEFDASGPEDRAYILDCAAGRIVFGDGVHGKVPPRGASITATYRHGGGERGNVGVAAVNRLENGPGLAVTNHFPAVGGREAETIAAATARAKRELSAPGTAVTLEDYEQMAKASPGLRVARAKAVAEGNTVKVAVVPYCLSGKPVAGPGFKRTVLEHLDRHRLLTTRVMVCDPEYVCVIVSAVVRIKEGFSSGPVRERCLTALNRFLSPFRRGKEDNAWLFGRPVYRSEVFALLDEVEGVDCVLRLSLSGTGGNSNYHDGNLIIGAFGLVYAGRHVIEVVRPQTACLER